MIIFSLLFYERSHLPLTKWFRKGNCRVLVCREHSNEMSKDVLKELKDIQFDK